MSTFSYDDIPVCANIIPEHIKISRVIKVFMQLFFAYVQMLTRIYDSVLIWRYKYISRRRYVNLVL